MFPVRPLRSIGITPLPHYYGPVRLPTRPILGLCLPQEWWNLSRTCRASQVPVHRFLDRSFGTRHPQSPRRTSRLLTPAASPSVLGFATFGRLAALTRCNEAESGSLALWLIPSPTQGFAKPDYSDPRLSGYMSNRLFTWWTPPCLCIPRRQASPQDRPGLAWPTRGQQKAGKMTGNEISLPRTLPEV